MGFAAIVDALREPMLWLIVFGAVFAVLQIWLVPRLRCLAGEAQVGHALERLFPAVVHDVILPDDRGGLTRIDHLALAPTGILVVATQRCRGRIFGQSNDATWTQAIGRQRNRFQNPLQQSYAQVRAVEALGLGVPIWKRVVFTNAAEFPNGRCADVSQLVTLDADLAVWRQGTISPELRQAWERLLVSARPERAARRAHPAGLRARFGGVPSGKRWALWTVPIVVALSFAGPWHSSARHRGSTPSRALRSRPRCRPARRSVHRNRRHLSQQRMAVLRSPRSGVRRSNGLGTHVLEHSPRKRAKKGSWRR